MSPEEEKEHERKLKWEMEDPQIIDVEYNGGACALLLLQILSYPLPAEFTSVGQFRVFSSGS